MSLIGGEGLAVAGKQSLVADPCRVGHSGQPRIAAAVDLSEDFPATHTSRKILPRSRDTRALIRALTNETACGHFVGLFFKPAASITALD
jgi:hypothetical protein